MLQGHHSWKGVQEGKSVKLQNVSRKTGNFASLMILSLLCKGMLSQPISSFKLTMPTPIYVQRGLYIHPPCQFTYNDQHQNSSEKVFGYWFKYTETRHSSKPYIKGGLVATNDESQRITSSISNRFHLEGKPEQGDCSFSISDVHLEDEGQYFFRIEKGHKVHYSFVDALFQLFVTGSHNEGLTLEFGQLNYILLFLLALFLIKVFLLFVAFWDLNKRKAPKKPQGILSNEMTSLCGHSLNSAGSAVK